MAILTKSAPLDRQTKKPARRNDVAAFFFGLPKLVGAHGSLELGGRPVLFNSYRQIIQGRVVLVNPPGRATKQGDEGGSKPMTLLPAPFSPLASQFTPKPPVKGWGVSGSY